MMKTSISHDGGIANSITDVVETTSGPIRGIVVGDVDTYLGVRYGWSRGGTNRFLPSELAYAVQGERYCDYYGSSAIQRPSCLWEKDIPVPLRPGLEQLLNLKEDTIRQSEDCLFLNIWSKKSVSKEQKPVLVWFHSEAFGGGSGGRPVYSGQFLAENEDLLVVSLNYRLNIFGHLNLAELGGANYSHSGNCGIKDAILALKWIQVNISKFNGNPNNITIAGQSEGGDKVLALLSSPEASGLFHKAIIQSCSCDEFKTIDSSLSIAKMLLHELDMERFNPEVFSGVRVKAILDAANKVEQLNNTGLSSWRPVCDENLISTQPCNLAGKTVNCNIPVLIGMNRNERRFDSMSKDWWGDLSKSELYELAKLSNPEKSNEIINKLLLIKPDHSYSELLAEFYSIDAVFQNTVEVTSQLVENENQVFSYIFSWQPKGKHSEGGASHLLEAPFVFNTHTLNPLIFEQDEELQEFGNNISHTWAQFMRFGDPNSEKLPAWPTYDLETRKTMDLNVVSKIIEDPYSDIRTLYDGA